MQQAANLARATLRPTPIPDTPARATLETSPRDLTLARAITETSSKHLPPARAKPASKPTRSTPARASSQPTPIDDTPARADVLTAIRLLGRTLDDLEKLRVQNQLRIGAAQRDGIDAPWADQIDLGLRAVEHAAKLELKRAWRKHALAPWAKAIPGAGEVLMARLIAEIGDPADRPNAGKLLAYCGHGDPARAGRAPKGATQEELFKRGNPHAKKATWKLAYQAMRTVGTPAPDTDRTRPIDTPPARVAPRSPYRDLYEQRKTDTEGKLHEKSCVRCGPAGKPALPGTPWSDAHRHHDALRIVGKRFLKDLWAAAKELQ